MASARIARTASLVQGYWEMLDYSLRNLRVLNIAPVKEIFYRQIYFTGVEALRIIAVLALLCGALVVTQVTRLVGGDSELTVRVLIWTLVQEAGPLLAAIIIIARSSPAIASELALMKAHNEFKYLAQMHINPQDYLVVPRFAGVTLAVVALSVYFQMIAVGGGLAVSALFQGVSFMQQLDLFLRVVDFSDLLMGAVKGCVFGMVIATISCYHGIHAAATSADVPKAAIKAVMQNLVFVFLLDALMAYFTH